jgi:glutamate decarboxylase
MIRQHPDFELTSAPQLNILTYRYCPEHVQQMLLRASEEQRLSVNLLLDQVNQLLQKDQREAGKTFVSRTRLQVSPYAEEITVLRVVLANPLTTDEILASVLAEQCLIVLQQDIQALLKQVETICDEIDGPPVEVCAEVN